MKIGLIMDIHYKVTHPHKNFFKNQCKSMKYRVKRENYSLFQSHSIEQQRQGEWQGKE